VIAAHQIGVLALPAQTGGGGQRFFHHRRGVHKHLPPRTGLSRHQPATSSVAPRQHRPPLHPALLASSTSPVPAAHQVGLGWFMRSGAVEAAFALRWTHLLLLPSLKSNVPSTCCRGRRQ
jgi:hypothetical protein